MSFFQGVFLYNETMSRIPLDPYTDIVEEHFAVIYAPRRHRDRFPENCVQIMASEQAAREAEDTEKNLFAARVVGPSRSSEGLRLYYLEAWLS